MPVQQQNTQTQLPIQQQSQQQPQEVKSTQQGILTPQFNSQGQGFNGQAQQFIPQQNQQFNPNVGQFGNQNLQPFSNQNQGGLNQNQFGSTNNQNVAQNLLNPIDSVNNGNLNNGNVNNFNNPNNSNNAPSNFDHRRGSGFIDCDEEFKNEILIFDNRRQELCKQPRQWNGQRCVCPSNGIFLSGKCFSQLPRESTRNIFSLRFINRNFDGSENNPKYPEWGARGNPLLRLTEPNYEDGKSEPLKRLPSPRDVSNVVGDIKNGTRFNNMFNQMFITWSQFIGNDITFTPTQANEPDNIPIPRCDRIFDKFCSGK